MDMIKELEKRKTLVKKLIDAEVDEKEVAKLNDELIEIVEEIATIKAEAKYTEKLEAEKVEAEKKEMKTKSDEPKVEITQTGMYKGINLKRAVAEAGQKKVSILEATKQDYGKVEAAAKWFIDMVDNAKSRPVEKATMVGLTTDALGGYITPTEERMELLSYMKQDSLALRDARVERMTGDKVTLPKELYNAVVAIRNESGEVGATSATFSQITLSTKGIDGYVVASKELVADSPLLIATLMSQFIEGTAKIIDSAVFKGTGSPMSGIFTSAVTTSATYTGVNFSSVTAAAIESILGQVLSRPQDTARLKWYAHPSVFYSYLKSLRAGGSTTTDGPYLFWDSVNGQGVPGRFAGFPIEYAYEAPYTTGAANTLAVFGDLTGVIIGERLNATSMFYDPYSSAANGHDRFYWFTRFAFSLAQELKLGRIRSAAA
jgi:HK97 family phage major capsid protein